MASSILMFFPGRIVSVVYSSLGVLVFSLYLIYDTQMMLGGKHKLSISPEEYIFAVLTIYLDVIQLFLHIIHLLGFETDWVIIRSANLFRIISQLLKDHR